MPRGKKKTLFGAARMYDTSIISEGKNEGCAHYEILTFDEKKNEIGVCQKCGRVKKYRPLYSTEKR